eukprot:s207_g10.t1
MSELEHATLGCRVETESGVAVPKWIARGGIVAYLREKVCLGWAEEADLKRLGETPKTACRATGHSADSPSRGKDSPEQELRQRGRSLLPFWRPTTSQAFATEVEQLGDSEASELLISGQLIRVKGWWRKGARFEQHSAEVRRSGPEGVDPSAGPVLRWGRDDASRRTLPLQGVAVECFPLDEYYGFRILPLPQSPAADPIDFATTEGDQRDLWMAAISIASAYKPKDPVADYPHRYVFWDSMLSSILIHRSLAAVEELAWVLQIILIQTFCAAPWARIPVLCTSTCMGLVIVTAECFSFTGTITQSFCWFAWEETCWTISFAMGLPVYMHLLIADGKLRRRRVKGGEGKAIAEERGALFDGKDFGLVMTLFCIGYVPYMAAVDVPSYWKDYQTQQLQHFVPNSFAEGVWNALTFREVTHNLSAWQSSLLWKSLYFTLGPWLSMAMMTAPVVEVDEVGKPTSECTSSSDV